MDFAEIDGERLDDLTRGAVILGVEPADYPLTDGPPGENISNLPFPYWLGWHFIYTADFSNDNQRTGAGKE